MQDGGDSTPKGAEESGSIKPERDSEQVDAGNSQSEQPEKVYDFYHQHFGVALAAGSQDARNAEAGSRASYASTAEVADKPGATSEKSASWNALKSLIRYQTSTTKEPEPQANFTTSGDSFEAQWLSKSSDDLPVLAESEPEPEAVRLKWTPIVDNVPESRWSKSESELEAEAQEEEMAAAAATTEAAETAAEIAEIVGGAEPAESAQKESEEIAQQTSQQSYEEALAATARGDQSDPEAAKPVAKKVFGKSRLARRPGPKPLYSANKSYEDALAATARGEQPVLPLVGSTGAATTEPPIDSTAHATIEPAGSASEATIEPALESTNEVSSEVSSEASLDSSSVLDDLDALLDEPTEEKVATSDVEDASEHNAAEARSKFGSMNAFARMQKRTKEQVETKEEQSITGDIPDKVQEEIQAGNWDTKPSTDAESVDGAAVMSQWCSTSTGDSLPLIPSLDELNSIPTPSVLKDGPLQPKPFSLSTPKPVTSENSDVTPDAMRHQASRASWLKAASEYSSSVIKAVTEQMKMLNAKPKKTTPESPEFHTAELPEASKEDS